MAHITIIYQVRSGECRFFGQCMASWPTILPQGSDPEEPSCCYLSNKSVVMGFPHDCNLFSGPQQEAKKE